MERSAAVAAFGTSPNRSARWPGPTGIAALLAAELGLLALGFATGHPFFAAAIAAAALYFLIALRSPDLAWLLVWIALPFSMERALPGGAAISIPTEPMIAIALGAWALRALHSGVAPAPSTPLTRPLLALGAVALCSTAVGLRPIVGIKAWLVTAAYVAFGFLYASAAPCDRPRRERWIRSAVAIGAACGLYGAARVLSEGVGREHAYGIARPFFANHGSYGALLGMLLPLAFLQAVDRRGLERAGYAAAAVSIFLGALLSFSRATWLALGVVMPLTAWIWASRSRSLRPAMILAAMALLLVGLGFALGATTKITRHASTVVQSENASNLERVNRWLAAAAMIEDRPWLGVGHGGYADAYRSYRRKIVITERAFEHMDAHSEVLRLLSEDGIVGFAAAIWFLGTAGWVGFRVVRQGADREVRLLALAVLAGLGTYCVHGTIDSYLGLDKISVPFWTGLGVLAALSARSGPSRARTRSPGRTGPGGRPEAATG